MRAALSIAEWGWCWLYRWARVAEENLWRHSKSEELLPRKFRAFFSRLLE